MTNAQVLVNLGRIAMLFGACIWISARVGGNLSLSTLGFQVFVVNALFTITCILDSSHESKG